MKKTICVIFVAGILYSCCINALAVEWSTVEKISSKDEPLLQRVGEYASGGYIFEFQGEKYIIGKRASNYSLPEKYNSIFPGEDYIETDNGYVVRPATFDELWSVRGIPEMGIGLYDQDKNLLIMHQFKENVCAIGYFNYTYYCQLFKTWKIYKSTDFNNWEETDESIPRRIGTVFYNDSHISFDGKNMIPVDYEDDIKRNFLSTMGNWIVKTDDELNFYLSNDNVYFAKIDGQSLKTQHGVNYEGYYGVSSFNLKCIYEYEDYIVAEIKGSPWVEYFRLMAPKQEIYDELKSQKSAPYVMYNNEILAFEQAPTIENDRTLIPIRFLFEQMGATVDWNGDIQTATISQDNTTITFAIDNTEADINGQTVSMDVPARLINGKTMVPVRFLSENLGYEVNWDGETRIITIK